MTSAVLLDTHAAIWFADGSLTKSALNEVALAGLAGAAYISPVTAWEIGLLARPHPRGAARPELLPNAQGWYARLVAQPLLTETQLTSQILISSSALPGECHNDPADRMLIATARALDCALVTHDRKILAYAAQGHLRIIPC